jgi:ribosome-binding ATPase YchF (GTP1/OBG family)
MKIGLVGYQGSGKSTLFEWLTGAAADPAQAHTSQSAMAAVPDPRIEGLCQVYHPKKLTQASIEIVDTPGLSRTHEGSAQRLALIRESGCLVLVLAAYGGANPFADLSSLEDDFLLADLDIVSNRVEKLRDQVKRPRPNRDELEAELKALEPLHATLEQGKPLRDLALTPDQQRAIRSFQLFSNKPRFLVFNTDDTESDPEQFTEKAPDPSRAAAVSLALQRELARMSQTEREEFCAEMGVQMTDTGDLLRCIMHTSGQMLFFTAGEKEVRTWLIPQGATAVEAAGAIHTDLAKGFIRAEVMQCDDLIRLGSEREIKAQGLMRQEHREYVIQDGDILHIRHN